MMFPNSALGQRRTCPRTTPDVEGPFFVRDGVLGAVVAPAAEMADPGQAVSLLGRVTTGSGTLLYCWTELYCAGQAAHRRSPPLWTSGTRGAATPTTPSRPTSSGTGAGFSLTRTGPTSSKRPSPGHTPADPLTTTTSRYTRSKV